MPVDPHYRPAQVHLRLGNAFYDVVRPAQFPKHVLRFRNQSAAARVGLGSLSDDEWLAHFGRFEPLPDNYREPLALRYHGHQFGVYNPQLGDGRGFLFAQLHDSRDGRLLDLGTKGSGTTPYSRGGDGKLTLKGGVREVLCTEMLESLGVYTSQTFSLIETGESLVRYDEPSPTRASVLVRLSHSHLRFGTFQRFLAHEQKEAIAQLVDHCLEHYLPEAHEGEGSKAVRFLRAVLRRNARLAASYMAAGFVHGVLNTDNMNITGESFDYGPYRFLPHYDPAFTAAYFDQGGRYAFARQPEVMHWNVMRLADTLTLIEEIEPLKQVIVEFDGVFWPSLFDKFSARLGVKSRGFDEDGVLFEAAIGLLGESGVSYDGFFFDWYGGREREQKARGGARAASYQGAAFDNFLRVLSSYEPRDDANLTDPYFARDEPCTLVIDEVERVWAHIAQNDDWSAFSAKIADIRAMGVALRGSPSALRF